MDFPPHGFSGRPRERPTKNVGGCGGGGSPPHEEAPSKKAKKTQKLHNKLKKSYFHKNLFFHNFNGIWEVRGRPEAWHGPYEAIPSNFGRVSSYMAWGKSIFMFFGNIGNSLHHQIPPNWSSGLQVGPRIFLKARAPSQEL